MGVKFANRCHPPRKSTINLEKTRDKPTLKGMFADVPKRIYAER